MAGREFSVIDHLLRPLASIDPPVLDLKGEWPLLESWANGTLRIAARKSMLYYYSEGDWEEAPGNLQCTAKSTAGQLNEFGLL